MCIRPGSPTAHPQPPFVQGKMVLKPLPVRKGRRIKEAAPTALPFQAVL